MELRCEAWSHSYFPCLGKARYVVRTTMPRETEQPTLCLTHAKVRVRKEAVPHGVIYGRSKNGQGWVAVKVSQGVPSSTAVQKATKRKPNL